MSNQTLDGQFFSFHIREEKNSDDVLEWISVLLASSYVYAPITRSELKGLADFIYKYLEDTE